MGYFDGVSVLGSPASLFRAVLCWPLIVPATVAHSATAIARALSGGSTQDVHRSYLGFSRFCMRVGGTHLHVYGANRIEPGQAYVVVSNHESNWDSLALIAGLPQLALRFVAKRQLLRIPLFGQALQLTGNVIVDRDRSGTDLKRIESQMSVRDHRVSMLFYAEGRRSRDGALHPFKTGAFATALAHKLPILPVAICGTRPIWPPESLRIAPGPAVIEVGEPMRVDGLEWSDRGKLRDRTREAVSSLRASGRARLREMGLDPGGID